MLKKTRKKAISFASTFFMLVFSFFACFSFFSFALDSRDWSLSYSKLSNINAVVATGSSGSDVVGSITMRGSNTSTGAISLGMKFSSVNMMFSRVLYTTNYGSNYLYLQDGYHYTVELELQYKYHNTASTDTSNDIYSGHDFRFCLTSSLQQGSAVGNYVVSNAIKSSSSYQSGNYTCLVFDFDISNMDDWPAGIISDGLLLFTGWGLVDYTDTMLGTYDVDLSVTNMFVKAYSPDDWQVYALENSIDAAASTIVDGFQHLDDATKDKIDSAVSDYNDAEEGIFDSLFSIIDDDHSVGFDFDFQDSLASYGSSFLKISEWIQYVYNEVPVVRIVIDVGFSMALFLLILKAV